MKVCFETAGIEDAEALITARNKSFYDDYIRFGECPGYNIPLEAMKQVILNVTVYKILHNGKLIGDISLQEREDGYYWIKCLEVIPEYQNKGIGAQALKYVQEMHPNAKKFGLDTPVQNTRNCHFYEKAGFHKTEDKFYSDLLTLRVYEKTIK